MELHEAGKNHSEIARLLGIRRPTIVAWAAHDEYADHRGWVKGQRRSHTETEEKRIVQLKEARIKDKKYFFGTPYLQMDYAKQFPNDPLPSTWFFDEVVRNHGLQTHEPKRRSRGQNIVSRLKFPIRSIVGLGKIQQSVDFIGKKYIHGSAEPISIFATSFYQWFLLYQIQRILAETIEQAIACLTAFWEAFPLTDVMRMDNATTWRGSSRGEACIGRFLIFLLNANVIPLFSAAYQSYTNPHIEGHNRTFTEKVWTKHAFADHDEIDRECARFNAESKEFFLYRFQERLAKKSLRRLTHPERVSDTILRSTKGKKLYFIRFVERWKESGDRTGIVILNRFVPIAEVYVNQYVLACVNLETATVSVTHEHDGIATIISQKPFPYSLY